MNNLCCLVNPKVICVPCAIKWCAKCAVHVSDHLIRTGYEDIRKCATTQHRLTYRIPTTENGVTTWDLIKRLRR